MMAQEPKNSVGPVVAARHRRVFRRPLGPHLGDVHLRPRQLQPVGGVSLRAGDLLARELAGGYRIRAANAVRDIAVGNALHLQNMQAAKVRDLLEGERGVLDEPNGCGFRHQRSVGHKFPPFPEARCPGFLGILSDCVGGTRNRRVPINIMTSAALCKQRILWRLNILRYKHASVSGDVFRPSSIARARALAEPGIVGPCPAPLPHSVRRGARQQIDYGHPGKDKRYAYQRRQVEALAEKTPADNRGENDPGPGPNRVGNANRDGGKRQRQEVKRDSRSPPPPILKGQAW